MLHIIKFKNKSREFRNTFHNVKYYKEHDTIVYYFSPKNNVNNVHA